MAQNAARIQELIDEGHPKASAILIARLETKNNALETKNKTQEQQRQALAARDIEQEQQRQALAARDIEQEQQRQALAAVDIEQKQHALVAKNIEQQQQVAPRGSRALRAPPDLPV